MADNSIPKKLVQRNNKFYCVLNGRTIGIFTSWHGCKASTTSYSKANYKGFSSLEEAVSFFNENGIGHEDIAVYQQQANKPSVEQTLLLYCESLKTPVPPIVKPIFAPPVFDTSVTVPVVNVDGACIDNGSISAKGGFGIYWGPNDPRNVSDPTPDDGVIPTNQRAELYAAIYAIEQAVSAGIDKLVIRSDSTYVVNHVATHVPLWGKKGELDSHPNTDLWKRLLNSTAKLSVQWIHVYGHKGDIGNTQADLLANQGAGSINATRTPSPDVPTALSIQDTEIATTSESVTVAESSNETESQDSSVPGSSGSAQPVSNNKSENEPILVQSSGELAGSTPMNNKPVIPSKPKLKAPVNRVNKPCDSTANNTDMQLLADILMQTNRHLKTLGNLHTTVRDIEHNLIDKLVHANASNSELKLTIVENQLDVYKKENADLKHKLKVKTDLVTSLECKFRKSNTGATPVDGISCTKCKDFEATMATKNTQQNKLRDTILDISKELASVKISRDSFEADLKIALKQQSGLQTAFNNMQCQLCASNELVEQMKCDLINARKKNGNLSDEVLSLKSHIGSALMTMPTSPSRELYSNVAAINTPDPSARTISHSNGWSSVLHGKRSSDTTPPTQHGTSTPNDSRNEETVFHSLNDDVDTVKQDIDVLFIGNSHFADFVPKKIYKNKVVKVQTLKEKNIQGATSFVSQCSFAPKVLVLQVSDNPIENNELDSCKTQMQELLCLCRKKFGDAHICVSDSLPRKLKSAEKQQNYDEKCAAFSTFLHELKDIHIIPHPKLVAVTDDLFRDGVHLTRKGLSLLVLDFKSIVNKLLGMKPVSEYIRDNAHQGPSHQSNHGDNYDQNFRPRNFRDKNFRLNNQCDNNQCDGHSRHNNNQNFHQHKQNFRPYPRRNDYNHGDQLVNIIRSALASSNLNQHNVNGNFR
jgi:ribonuclease HI